MVSLDSRTEPTYLLCGSYHWTVLTRSIAAGSINSSAVVRGFLNLAILLVQCAQTVL